jgi:hypothetical protein
MVARKQALEEVVAVFSSTLQSYLALVQYLPTVEQVSVSGLVFVWWCMDWSYMHQYVGSELRSWYLIFFSLFVCLIVY